MSDRYAFRNSDLSIVLVIESGNLFYQREYNYQGEQISQEKVHSRKNIEKIIQALKQKYECIYSPSTGFRKLKENIVSDVTLLVDFFKRGLKLGE